MKTYKHQTKGEGSIFIFEHIFSENITQKVLDTVLKMPLIKATPESGGFDTITFDMGLKINNFYFEKIYSLLYKRLEHSLRSEFGINAFFDRNKICSPSIKIQYPGQYHVIHSDHEYSNSKANVASKILMENSISSVVSLSSDYEGGALIFPEEDISINLEAGSACVFTSIENKHGVTEVTDGIRYSLLNFGEVVRDGR